MSQPHATDHEPPADDMQEFALPEQSIAGGSAQPLAMNGETLVAGTARAHPSFAGELVNQFYDLNADVPHCGLIPRARELRQRMVEERQKHVDGGVVLQMSKEKQWWLPSIAHAYSALIRKATAEHPSQPVNVPGLPELLLDIVAEHILEIHKGDYKLMRPLSDHRLRHISNVEKWADESVVASDLSALEVEIQVFRVGRYLGLEQLQGYALIHVGNVLAKEKPDLPTFAKAVAVAFVPCPLTDGTELQPLLASYAAINYDIWVRQPGDTLPNLMSLGSFGYHCTRAQQCYAPEKLKLPAPKDTEVVPNLTDQHAQERLEKPPSNGGGNTLSGVEGHADNTSSSVFKTPANGVKGHSGSPMDTSPGHTSQPAGGPRMHHGKASRSNIKPKAKPLLSATPLLDLEYLFRPSPQVPASTYPSFPYSLNGQPGAESLTNMFTFNSPSPAPTNLPRPIKKATGTKRGQNVTCGGASGATSGRGGLVEGQRPTKRLRNEYDQDDEAADDGKGHDAVEMDM